MNQSEEQLRRKFYRFLGLGVPALDLNSTLTQRTVESICAQFPERFLFCNSPEKAADLYWLCRNRITTRVQTSYLHTKQIAFDGYLTHTVGPCNFERIIKDSESYIFKYPKSPDDELAAAACQRDTAFCELMTNLFGSDVPAGLVHYTQLNVPRSTRGDSVAIGSISKVYDFSMDQFSGAVPDVVLVSMLSRLSVTLDLVHSVGYVIGDVKPGNLFFSRDHVDIGDFGGEFLLPLFCSL